MAAFCTAMVAAEMSVAWPVASDSAAASPWPCSSIALCSLSAIRSLKPAPLAPCAPPAAFAASPPPTASRPWYCGIER